MKRSVRYFLALALTAALILGAAMPALAAEPEETAAPEAAVAPAETAGPETTGEPEQTAEPETTGEPEATTEPEAADAPAVTEEPETTAEPAAEAASADVGVRITAGGESRDYATIDEAWAAAVEAGTATVTLLADVTAQEILTVPAGVSISFAGGENTLSTVCIHVDGGTLTIENGTVQDTGDGATNKTGAINIDAGRLTVNGGTVRGLNGGIYCDGGETTINGGVICGENGGLAVTDADSLTVNGGDISGSSVGIACMGSNRPVINGGSISSEGGGGLGMSIGVLAYSGLVLNGGEVTGGDIGIVSTGDTTVTGGSVTGTEGFGLLLGEEGSASLSGGAYAGVDSAVSCGGANILGDQIDSPLTVNDLPADGYGWYNADGELLTPAADAKSLAGPVTVGPLPVATATPVLKVTGENVLLSSDPTDIDQKYDAPLTDGALIEGGAGRIVVPAEYVVEFPDAGVEITEQRYKFDNRYEPDTLIYHRYVFQITDPTLTELNVTVSPNPDTPTWTKVTSHTYADFSWSLTDCANNRHSYSHADDEHVLYAAEDASGVTLDLSKAPEGAEPLMKTGTATGIGGGKYTLFSDNGVIEFTLAPGGIRVNVTGETNALIRASEYVMDRYGENYFRVYVKTGYAVVPADENTEVTMGYISENDDGSDRLHYHVNADAAAEKGLESVTVRIEKITSATLSVNEPDALLAADPYGSDRSPILTNGDVIPPEGGWLLTRGGWWPSGDSAEYAYDDRGGPSFGEPGGEVYMWWYVYPLKNGVVNAALEDTGDEFRWAEVTVNNPGGRRLELSTYGKIEALDSLTFTKQTIVANYIYIGDDTGSLRKADDITDTVGIQSVTEYSDHLMLRLDPAAEKISFTVKAPAGGTTPTPTPAPTATAVPTATPVPSAAAEPTATPVPTAAVVPTATAAPTATSAPTATPAPTAVPTATAAPAATATAAPGTASPKTGDETALAPWALMLLGCGAALIAVTARRRAGR